MESSNQSLPSHVEHEARQLGSRYSAEPGAGGYDDEFVEAVAQRLAQRLLEGQKGLLKERAPSPAQRLTLAILSLIALIAILISSFGIMADVPDSVWILIVLTIFVCIAVSIINIAFSAGHRE